MMNYLVYDLSVFPLFLRAKMNGRSTITVKTTYAPVTFPEIYILYGICIMMADINHIANNSLKIATYTEVYNVKNCMVNLMQDVQQDKKIN